MSELVGGVGRSEIIFWKTELYDLLSTLRLFNDLEEVWTKITEISENYQTLNVFVNTIESALTHANSDYNKQPPEAFKKLTSDDEKQASLKAKILKGKKFLKFYERLLEIIKLPSQSDTNNREYSKIQNYIQAVTKPIEIVIIIAICVRMIKEISKYIPQNESDCIDGQSDIFLLEHINGNLPTAFMLITLTNPNIISDPMKEFLKALNGELAAL